MFQAEVPRIHIKINDQIKYCRLLYIAYNNDKINVPDGIVELSSKVLYLIQYYNGKHEQIFDGDHYINIGYVSSPLNYVPEGMTKIGSGLHTHSYLGINAPIPVEVWIIDQYAKNTTVYFNDQIQARPKTVQYNPKKNKNSNIRNKDKRRN